MKMNDTLLGHGILVEHDGKIHDLLVRRQTGLGSRPGAQALGGKKLG